MYLNIWDDDLGVHSGDVDFCHLHVCTVAEYINGFLVM